MIARKHRFHGHGSLRYVYQHGQTVRGPMIALKYAENSKRTSYRLAVVVSKKIQKTAVGRNRIRRRLYEAVRRLEPAMQHSTDMVITVFSEQILNLSASELNRMVHAQLRQARIIAANKGSHDKI